MRPRLDEADLVPVAAVATGTRPEQVFADAPPREYDKSYVDGFGKLLEQHADEVAAHPGDRAAWPSRWSGTATAFQRDASVTSPSITRRTAGSRGWMRWRSSGRCWSATTSATWAQKLVTWERAPKPVKLAWLAARTSR